MVPVRTIGHSERGNIMRKLIELTVDRDIGGTNTFVADRFFRFSDKSDAIDPI